MNQEIIKEISNDLSIKIGQIEQVLNLLKEGNTVPFIARYRKEKTGALTEEEIKKIYEVYEYELNLLKRKEDVIRLIEEKDLMTEELRTNIMKAKKLVEVEDLYRPFKEKKKTKATEAIKNGLEPLAKIIMSFPIGGNVDDMTSKFVNETVKTKDDALQGASYIIAEWISDNAYYRKWIRNYIYRNGIIKTKLKNNENDLNKIYEMYYDYREELNKIKPHRILAINRAEKEKVICVNFDIDNKKIIEYLESKIIKNDKSFVLDIVKESIMDSFKRLIYPSIEREIRSDLTEKAEDKAIVNFGKNLESLLLTPPIKEKIVLAFDPGFVNGCKIAVIDQTGKYLDSTVIKPFLKNNSELNISKDKKTIADLINKYKVDVIAIGNGTASRESEKFCSELIKENNLNIKYVIISEAGASIYSASKIAIEEFPDLEIEKRSAVSIGRRLQDPLSELVKIPPEGIGVGLYQHDVQTKKLKENLDFIVEEAVNKVGVNINTAGPSILKYVSGITKPNIDKIIKYREEKGRINSREELKKILSDKTYVQSVGFLRITEGVNPLDQTDIHPESYDITKKLLDILDLNISQIGTDYLIDKLDNINLEEYKDKLNTDIYTLTDIVESLKKPNRDPRDEYPQPVLKSDILNIEDLKVGMKLQGTVRNVIDFGAFIDIGLHNDGLAHISKISKEYIHHPTDILSVGDIVECTVIDINKEKEKVSLSLIEE